MSATRQHLAPVYWVLQKTRDHSVRRRAEDVVVPELSDRAMIERGFGIYKTYCVQCHTVPGIVGPDARVGPPLERIATRKYIAGVLPNTPKNMIRWLRFPQQVDPRSAMPDLGVSEQHARDIAAYLYTLR